MLDPQEMVLELIGMKLTQKEIEQLTGVDQSQISRIKHGKQTSYKNGKKIEELYLAKLNELAESSADHDIS